MQGKLWLTLGIAFSVALAGCAQKKDETDMGDDEPPMTNQPGGGTYTVTTTGVPAQATPGVAFTFTLNAAGPAGTSDHLGAHYGMNASDTPSTTTYPQACEHQNATLPGTFTVRCTLVVPGTWHLRGHVRTGTEGNYTHAWGPDNTITVGTGGGTPSLETIRVGTDVPFVPFETFNTSSNDYEGFDIDLMREIGKRAGFTPQFETRTFATLIPSLESGDIDAAISSMSINAEREEQVDFSIPYYEANQSVLVRAADDGKYGDLESMKGKGLKFGVQTGTVGEAEAVEAFGNASVLRYETYDVMLSALKSSAVDALVMDLPQQKSAASQDNAVVIAFDFNVDDVYGIAVKKGNAVLLAKINTALTSMFADGSYDDLREKWDV